MRHKERLSMKTSRTSLAVVSTLSIVAGLAAFGAPEAGAQGCVASRLNAPSSPMNTEGTEYYLAKGKWQLSLGYRNFFSHRHFVGDVEQDGSPGTRDRTLNPVENHVHIPEIAVTYGISDRWSATLDVPIPLLYRRNPPRSASATSPAVPAIYTNAKGIGDTNLMGRFWVASPSHNVTQNLSVGLGIKFPTGKDDAEGTFAQVVGGQVAPWVHPVDQSIQPGDGGFGFITEVQAFKSFGSVTAYFTGEYLFNPKGTNGVPTGRSDPNEAIMSVADQFGARVGAAVPLSFLKGLGVSLGARLEGIPVYDLFGSSAGFRRPGYSIGIEPGISYSWGLNSFAFSFPYLVYRNRTQSYADKLRTTETGTYHQGDAAFADYIFIAGYTRRF
jgi:hypothetical protein